MTDQHTRVVAAGPSPGSETDSAFPSVEWTERHFEEMADAIVGSSTQVTIDGNRTPTSVVGVVTDAHVDDEHGLVYEMEIYDETYLDHLRNEYVSPAPVIHFDTDNETVEDIPVFGLYPTVSADVTGVLDIEDGSTTLSAYLKQQS